MTTNRPVLPPGSAPAGPGRKLDKTSTNRLRMLVREGQYDTDKPGHFTKLVERGYATKVRLPYEYRDVFRFSPTKAGAYLIGPIGESKP